MSIAHIGQGYFVINTGDFNLENMLHINRKTSLNFLKHPNRIITVSDYLTKSLSIIIITMSEQQLLVKFALPFTPRIEEGFDCFLWANKR
jgi:hypothetical protein